jgi:predicted enzyme related to lactoylglutathione lyase
VALGGVAGEISESPSGLSAVCGDDQGTRFSLWQPAPGFEG